MKIKTNELEGAALDWAVAKAADAPCYHDGDIDFWLSRHRFNPSESWMFGGPIVDRFVNHLCKTEYGCYADAVTKDGSYCLPLDECDGKGDTMLIAAMRAIVASEIGDEVDVPEELL